MGWSPDLPYSVPARLVTVQVTRTGGMAKKVRADGPEIWVSARTYGGTERTTDGVYGIEDTMVIETWYRPDITRDTAVRLLDDGSVWEILSAEDIGRQHRWLVLKCRRQSGEAVRWPGQAGTGHTGREARTSYSLTAKDTRPERA